MKKIEKIRVFHGYYGCETGCCGHIVEINDDEEHFEFEHPWGKDHKEWATKFAKKMIQRHFPECMDSIDWDSIEIEYEDVSENC